MKKIHIVLAAVMLLASVKVMAQASSTPRADARQKAQRGRIAEGRQDGEVTNREAVRLHQDQRHIRRSERRVKADGEVTGREKARLERKQNRASRHVRRSKHNKVDMNN